MSEGKTCILISAPANAWLIFLVVLIATTSTLLAQPQDRRYGIGGLVGTLAGFSAKIYTKQDSLHAGISALQAIDMSIAWSSDDIVLISAHDLTHRIIRNSPLNIFLGGGPVFGSDHRDLVGGVSTVFGVFFEKHRFDVFLQITPQIIILPDLHGRFGSAIGLRYYL